MAIERRGFLVLGAAACVAPVALPASSGSPVLGTWRTPDGVHRVGALDGRASLPLPGRAHGVAITADGATAFVVARRPGRFLARVDLRAWTLDDTVRSPPGRRVYGHAALSADGKTLYVTENDYEAGRGRIGVYDAGPPLERLGEIPSHGVGPHEIRRWPGGDLLAVANGGVRTHPATGREKLNLDAMTPSVALIDPADGSLIAEARPPGRWRRASIRHLDVAGTGLAVVGVQWEGDGPSPAPVAVWDGSGPLSFADESSREALSLAGYVGSVAFDGSGTLVAATSPRGGAAAFWEASDMRPLGTWPLTDVCGLCPGDGERTFTVTNGLGTALTIAPDTMAVSPFGSGAAPRAWDNHLARA